MRTALTLGIVALITYFYFSLSRNSDSISARVVIPPVNFISASEVTLTWLQIEKTEADYVVEWEIQRPDGSLAIDDFHSPAGVVLVPKGGGLISLKLQLTPRAKMSTFSGERFHLKVREEHGRFEALSAVIVNLEQRQSAGL